MGIPTLKTKRLVLQELTLNHEKDYFEGFVDWEVVRYMNGSIPWPYPKDGVRNFIKSVIPKQGKTLWQWGIFLKEQPNKLIGSIEIRKSDTDNRGFWLAKPYWGQGYMSEASLAVTDYAFESLGFDVLKFTNSKVNIGSRRIKEKMGIRLVSLSKKIVWTLKGERLNIGK